MRALFLGLAAVLSVSTSTAQTVTPHPFTAAAVFGTAMTGCHSATDPNRTFIRRIVSNGTFRVYSGANAGGYTNAERTAMMAQVRQALNTACAAFTNYNNRCGRPGNSALTTCESIDISVWSSRGGAEPNCAARNQLEMSVPITASTEHLIMNVAASSTFATPALRISRDIYTLDRFSVPNGSGAYVLVNGGAVALGLGGRPMIVRGFFSGRIANGPNAALTLLPGGVFVLSWNNGNGTATLGTHMPIADRTYTDQLKEQIVLQINRAHTGTDLEIARVYDTAFNTGYRNTGRAVLPGWTCAPRANAEETPSADSLSLDEHEAAEGQDYSGVEDILEVHESPGEETFAEAVPGVKSNEPVFVDQPDPGAFIFNGDANNSESGNAR